MKTSKTAIFAPVEKELKEFNRRFKSSMKSPVPLLNKITHFLVQRKGKQMRPLFVFLSAKMFGAISDNTYTAAALIELMHTATLVHDDVVDDAHLRRGFFSINALWKNKIAVLVGDFLLARSLTLAIDNKQFDQLENLSNTVKAMSEGELLQIEKARKLDITEDIYFEIIKAKTASLIKSACRAGTMSTTKDQKTIDLMGQIGEYIGIAFQIKDDLFDYGTAKIGKPTGIDIQEQKMTLPLIYALQKADKNTKKDIIQSIKKHNKDKKHVKKVIEQVKQLGGLDYAQKKMENYHHQALKLIEEIPHSEAKSSFIDLIDYTIKRKI